MNVRVAVLLLTATFGSSALACEGKAACAREHAPAPDARRAAKGPHHIGQHCSYSTAQMIGRVLDSGQAWTYEGILVPVDHSGDDAYATPFRTEADDRVLANEVLDQLGPETPTTPLLLEGRALTQDGKRFVVVTSVAKAS